MNDQRTKQNEGNEQSEAIAQWTEVQRRNVLSYLEVQKVKHLGVPIHADWQIPPYVSVWRVASQKGDGAIGWWVISGDVPTDYISSGNAANAREAIKCFASNWAEASEYLRKGEQPPNMAIGTSEERPKVGAYLANLASALFEWVEEDERWA